MNLFGTLKIVLHSQTNSEIKDLYIYRLLVLCHKELPENVRSIAQIKVDAHDNPVVF